MRVSSLSLVPSFSKLTSILVSLSFLRLCGSSPWDSKEPWDLVQETVKMREVNFKGRRFDRVSEEGSFFFLSSSLFLSLSAVLR